MNTKTSQLDHVWEIAKKIKTCMLTTLSADRMRSRPMHAMPDREAGCLWFITDQRGAKDEEIKAAPEVCLAFTDTGSNTYLSLTGRAEMLRDVAKIGELWSVEAQAWWPKGPTDGWDLNRCEARKASDLRTSTGPLASFVEHPEMIALGANEQD